MKLYAVSIALSMYSKKDYEDCFLLFAENAEEAQSRVKEDREEEEYAGYYSYDVVEVDMDKLQNGKKLLVYGNYHN